MKVKDCKFAQNTHLFLNLEILFLMQGMQKSKFLVGVQSCGLVKNNLQNSSFRMIPAFLYCDK
jgi:hypothetical protein